MDRRTVGGRGGGRKPGGYRGFWILLALGLLLIMGTVAVQAADTVEGPGAGAVVPPSVSPGQATPGPDGLPAQEVQAQDDGITYSLCGWVLDTSEHGIIGATLTLWAWDGSQWILADTDQTVGPSGYFFLQYVGGPTAGFAVTEQNAPGYISVSAVGPPGWVTINPDRLEYFGTNPLGCVFFYDRLGDTPTRPPGPTVTSSPTATATGTPPTNARIFQGYVRRPVGTACIRQRPTRTTTSSR